MYRVGTGGKQPEYYTGSQGWAKIKGYLNSGVDMVIMTLGGNGTSGAKKMIKKVKSTNKTKNCVYIWIGAPPPATDGTTYQYSKNYEPRKKKNDFLQKEISGLVNYFINPYSVQSFQLGYGCNSKCDGIHVPGDIAKIFLINAGIIESDKPLPLSPVDPDKEISYFDASDEDSGGIGPLR